MLESFLSKSINSIDLLRKLNGIGFYRKDRKVRKASKNDIIKTASSN